MAIQMNGAGILELELDSEHINFYEFITNIDDNNISITHENSFEWFDKKPISPSVPGTTTIEASPSRKTLSGVTTL